MSEHKYEPDKDEIEHKSEHKVEAPFSEPSATKLRPKQYLMDQGIRDVLAEWSNVKNPEHNNTKILSLLASTVTPRRQFTRYTPKEYKRLYKEGIHELMFQKCQNQIGHILSLPTYMITNRINPVRIPTYIGDIGDINDKINTPFKLWLIFFNLNIDNIPNKLFRIYNLSIRVINRSNYDELFYALKNLNNDRTIEDLERRIKTSLYLALNMNLDDLNCNSIKLDKLRNLFGVGRRKKTYKRNKNNKKTHRKTYRKNKK
jgi:hypothetical protein